MTAGYPRAIPLACCFAGCIAILIGRLFQLQVVDGAYYAATVDESREVVELLPAMRGRILDRHGVAIADNRAVYNIGVILSDLEMPWLERRQIPFFVLDEQHFDAFIADLGLRLSSSIPAPAIREIVLKELMNFPGVAVRYGSSATSQAIKLLAIPRSVLVAKGDEPEEGASDAAILAGSDLICEDPRAALSMEIAKRWSQGVDLLTPDEFKEAAALIPADSTGGERCATVLDAFAPVISVELPGKDPISGEATTLRWRLLTEERRSQAEAALSRFLGSSPQDIHEQLSRAIEKIRGAQSHPDFYFGPSFSAEDIAAMLPADAGFTEISIGNVTGVRERHFIIQGDGGGETPGLFTQLQNRLSDSLGAHIANEVGRRGDWVGALLERHAERTRAQSCERNYRLHQLALDPAKLARLCAGLAERLTRHGIPTTSLDVEQSVALARRIADKEWVGQTRNDVINIVRDVPHRIALLMDQGSESLPKEFTQRYHGDDRILPGLTLRIGVGRAYPFPGCASHVIGTLGRVAAQFDAATAASLGLDPEGWQGSTGLERKYDDEMRGIAGSRVRARTGVGVSALLDDPPIGGQDLRTELDLELQLLAEDNLAHWFELGQAMGTATDKMAAARAVGNGRAGCVMIDCKTGGILVLASSPSYRLDELGERYAELNDPKRTPGQPLHDYASEASQPPGSVMKILTALAALESKHVTPNEEIYSAGYMALVKGEKVLRDHAPAGTYDLPRAIQYSSNVYFAVLGGRMKGDLLSDYFSSFGMGTNNALDVLQQRPGILPRPSNLARLRPAEPKWLPGDSWRMAIGQFLSAAPLQVVTIAAAVANGGHVVSPYLVQPEGGPAVKDLSIRQDYLDVVRRGMELVTDNREASTAKYLILEGAAAGIKVAAKTGTSEWGSRAGRESGRNPDHAWLIGYAPADNPVIAFAIFIHSGTSGGRACSPVAKKLLEAYFTRYGREGHAAAK